jgi:hypothetical protein
MDSKTDCAQIVLTCGAARNSWSAALQPGQPLTGIINPRIAGVTSSFLSGGDKPFEFLEPVLDEFDST